MSQPSSPLMQQYQDVKLRFPGNLVFFRIGDFYEMFFDDAVIASRELEIALTSRSRDRKGDPIPMCGVPHHAVDGYLSRLVKKGYKVVICEQMEDPKPGQLVRRDVVRVVTPGTVTEDSMLEPKDNNFLGAVLLDGAGFGAAFLDVSTGDFWATEHAGEDSVGRIAAEINHFQPAEIIYPACDSPLFSERTFRVLIDHTAMSEVEDHFFHADDAHRLLLATFGTSTLDGYGLSRRRRAVAAAGAVVRYAREQNRGPLENITGLRYFEPSDFLRLDTESVSNLELVRSVSGDAGSTLLHVLDFTCTSMGGRLLKSWVLRPLMDETSIHERQSAVGELAGGHALRTSLQECLEKVQDMERLLGKTISGTAKPRDLLGLRNSIRLLPSFHGVVGRCSSALFRKMAAEVDVLDDVRDRLDRTLHDDPPASFNDGGFVRDGFSQGLDELRDLSRGGKGAIAEMEEAERRRTGISSLKIGFNRVFGYYIEVTKSNLHLIPDDYSRKQTVAQAERFVTVELKEHEERVLSAEDRMLVLEKEIYSDLRRDLAAASKRVLAAARAVSETDALASLAEAAKRHRYTRPVVTESDSIRIAGGRHPVVERAESGFIPNDCVMDGADCRMILLTGPNMGGKSTFLRQNALIVIMAQMGSFVPADSAEIGIVDQIFTRVGASDNLAKGRSTFMVEMIETANILHTCTPRGLVLLDEVGRGTATFDGLSIAWAVAEFVLTDPVHRAKTFFATHYHELTQLESVYTGIRNFCVTVKESGDDVLFLRKVVPGSANRSYGIEVARLAGMPKTVVQRASDLLRRLERKELNLAGRTRKSVEEAIESLGPRRLF